MQVKPCVIASVAIQLLFVDYRHDLRDQSDRTQSNADAATCLIFRVTLYLSTVTNNKPGRKR